MLNGLLKTQYTITSLVVFRMGFGAIILWETLRYFKYDWIEAYYIQPLFHFHYPGFDWIQPWPGDGMYIHFACMAFFGLCILFGFLYRINMALFFLSFSYVFLLEQARYLNHFYLIVLLSFLMVFVPAHKAYSLDALIWPKIKQETIASWSVNLLRFQLAVAYTYGGIAKLNTDWLNGKPMDLWLTEATDFPFIGKWFNERWMALTMSYGGLLLDLFIVPLLLFRRTRLFAFAAIFLFHLTNDRLFSIGIFPWAMILMTTLFLPTKWPICILDSIRKSNASIVTYFSVGIFFAFIVSIFHRGSDFLPLSIGFLAGLILTWLVSNFRNPQEDSSKSTFPPPSITKWLLGMWVMFQLIVPLRHLFIPGDVNWTEEGHRFSWHMKLRDKQGSCRFIATSIDAPNDVLSVNPQLYLTAWQYRKMVSRPYLIRPFADYIATFLQAAKGKDYVVRAVSEASLNGREEQPLVDPNIDLNKVSYTDWGRNQWVLIEK